MSRAIADALLTIGAVGFSPQNPITFKSGIISPVYVDNRKLPYHPQQWTLIIQAFQQLIEREALEYDIIAGVAMGGVPHSAALGYVLQHPSVFVRKEAKEHGKGQRIEGGTVENKHVVLVEDLITTGGSSLSGVVALQDAGAIVRDVVAIVSYGFSEAQENFAKANLRLHTLTNFEDILAVAAEKALFAANEADIIKQWFTDPHGWASKFL